MTPPLQRLVASLRLPLLLAGAALLGACSHPLVVTPLETPARNEALLIPKKVAYVMTDADRGKEFKSEGGGGDFVTYFAYRDLEKAIRDALRAVYADVFALQSATDRGVVQGVEIAFVFTPQITTTSKSSSLLTWPPTEFGIELTCRVTDLAGSPVTEFKVSAAGAATFSEFRSDLSLSARRAATGLSEKLAQELRANPRLR